MVFDVYYSDLIKKLNREIKNLKFYCSVFVPEQVAEKNRLLDSLTTQIENLRTIRRDYNPWVYDLMSPYLNLPEEVFLQDGFKTYGTILIRLNERKDFCWEEHIPRTRILNEFFSDNEFKNAFFKFTEPSIFNPYNYRNEGGETTSFLSVRINYNTKKITKHPEEASLKLQELVQYFLDYGNSLPTERARVRA